MDANKCTALNTAVVFYFLNGYRFEYDDEARSLLKQFGTDEATVEETTVVEYLRSHSEEIDLAGEIVEWRDHLLRVGQERTAHNDHSHCLPPTATPVGSDRR